MTRAIPKARLPQPGERWMTEKGGVVTIMAAPCTTSPYKENLWNADGGGVWNPNGTPWQNGGLANAHYGRLVRRVSATRKPLAKAPTDRQKFLSLRRAVLKAKTLKEAKAAAMQAGRK